jgi:pilus assembly protein Flp/PilA
MLYLTFLTQSAKERGAGLAEYALLLALIAVVCVAALTTLGGNIAAIFDFIAGELV